MLAPTPDEVRYINFELFPASYVTPDGISSGNQMKIIATSDHLVAFLDKEVVGAVWILTSFEKVDRNTYRVLTAEDDWVTVKRENNCGCGNQLRGWHPYQGKSHIAHYPFLRGT